MTGSTLDRPGIAIVINPATRGASVAAPTVILLGPGGSPSDERHGLSQVNDRFRRWAHGKALVMGWARRASQTRFSSTEGFAVDMINGAVVMVFEGNAILRLSVEALLESWGCHVISGDSPDDILQAIQEEGVHPDVMLISPKTDRNTGARIASRVEAQVGHPIPSLGITEEPGLLRQHQGDGTFLEMPCSPDALHAAIVQAITRSQATRTTRTS